MHQDPVTKSQRLTDAWGNVVAAIELDPYGGETDRSSNQYLQPHRYTTWERNSTGDESLFRRYHGWWSRFAHPDPSDGSYNAADPQSFNRYSYVQNDPVNFIDPTGLVSQEDEGVDPTKRHMGGWEGALSSGGGFNFMFYLIPGIERGYPNLLVGLFFGFGGQQNPYDVRTIFSEARDAMRNKERNKQALREYENCVKDSPEGKAFEQAFNKAALKASLPIPGALGIGKVTMRTVTGAAAGRGVIASLVTSSNIFTLAFSAALNVLMANSSCRDSRIVGQSETRHGELQEADQREIRVQIIGPLSAS